MRTTRELCSLPGPRRPTVSLVFFFRGTIEYERNRIVIMGDVAYNRIVFLTLLVVKDFVLRANDESSQTVILEATFIGMRETSGLQELE